eukprot:4091495-Prymnesium_polylepis.1
MYALPVTLYQSTGREGGAREVTGVFWSIERCSRVQGLGFTVETEPMYPGPDRARVVLAKVGSWLRRRDRRGHDARRT